MNFFKKHVSAFVVGLMVLVVGYYVEVYRGYGKGFEDGRNEAILALSDELRDSAVAAADTIVISMATAMAERLCSDDIAAAADQSRREGYDAGEAQGYSDGVTDGQRQGFEEANYLSNAFARWSQQIVEVLDGADDAVIEDARIILDTSERARSVLAAISDEVFDGPMVEELQAAVEAGDVTSIRTLLRVLEGSLPARARQLADAERLLGPPFVGD